MELQCHKGRVHLSTIIILNIILIVGVKWLQCNQAREQNFLKSYFWAKTYTDKPT